MLVVGVVVVVLVVVHWETTSYRTEEIYGEEGENHVMYGLHGEISNNSTDAG